MEPSHRAWSQENTEGVPTVGTIIWPGWDGQKTQVSTCRVSGKQYLPNAGIYNWIELVEAYRHDVYFT